MYYLEDAVFQWPFWGVNSARDRTAHLDRVSMEALQQKLDALYEREKQQASALQQKQLQLQLLQEELKQTEHQVTLPIVM